MNQQKYREQNQRDHCADTQIGESTHTLQDRNQQKITYEANCCPESNSERRLILADADHIHEIKREITEQNVTHQIGAFKQKQPAQDLATFQCPPCAAETVAHIGNFWRRWCLDWE